MINRKDLNAAHHGGADAEEVSEVLPLLGLPFHEAEEGFVDKGAGLQDVAGTFGGEIRRRQIAKFPVDERCEAGESLGVTVAPSGKHASDLGRCRRIVH